MPQAESDSGVPPCDRAIGARLRVERERLGLSQDAFAAKVGVHRNTQCNYEKGVRAFDTDYMHSIKGIGVDVVYVLDGIRSDTARYLEAMMGLCSALLSALGYADPEITKIKEDAIVATEPYGVEHDSREDWTHAMQELANRVISRSPAAIRVRYGVNEATLTMVLEALVQSAQEAGISIPPSKMGQAATMLYRQAVETGKVDAELAAMAVKLAR